jgi:two-component system, OmpR family, KDP operon response regulator KdpE
MVNNKPTILAVEDNLPIRRFLKSFLLSQGFRVLETNLGKEAIDIVLQQKPNTVLLDLTLPDMNGFEVIKALRAWTQIPIIILSAHHEESDKVQALNLGADDYLTKPFSVEELNARLRVALRHAERINERENEPIFDCGQLHINYIAREVVLNNKTISLSPIQYEILIALAKKVNRIVTHKQLLFAVWGEGHTEDVDYLRIYIHQLRHKLESNPAHPKYLRTIPGVGYRLSCV